MRQTLPETEIAAANGVYLRAGANRAQIVRRASAIYFAAAGNVGGRLLDIRSGYRYNIGIKFNIKFKESDMKYNFKGITAEELSFKLNRVKLNPENKLDIKPQFSRQVRKVNGNDVLNFVALSVKIESTENEPKPFDINVTLVGVFDLEEAANDAEERDFVIEATRIIYPYLRAAVTNLTASAYIAPLNLPVIMGPIFPEDRETYAFSLDDSKLN